MRYEEQGCKECRRRFSPIRLHQVFCSAECRKEHYKESYFAQTFGHMSKIDKSASGTVGELKASADLILRGWEVFRALNPHTSCDLLAIKNNKMIRVEVKTGFERDGKAYTAPIKHKDRYDLLIQVTPKGIYYTPELEELGTSNSGTDS